MENSLRPLSETSDPSSWIDPSVGHSSHSLLLFSSLEASLGSASSPCSTWPGRSGLSWAGVGEFHWGKPLSSQALLQVSEGESGTWKPAGMPLLSSFSTSSKCPHHSEFVSSPAKKGSLSLSRCEDKIRSNS